MVDYLIVGQGVAGTVLHRKLTLAGYTAVVIDEGHHQASSKVAAGLINPITGRKYVKSWRIEDFLPVAEATYEELSQFLRVQVYSRVHIHRALYSIKDENIWHSRREDPLANQYINDNADVSAYDEHITNTLSYGSLKGGLQIHLPQLITAYQDYLRTADLLITERYEASKLQLRTDGVKYGEISASGIIFAEGHQARHNPLWQGLAFTPVKGEVLLVDIEGSPFTDVLRHKLFITPLPSGQYWIGSGYQWDFEDDKPTTQGREKLEAQLADILITKYEVRDHIAGIRPSVKDRKPFLGTHREHKQIHIFNGMGTKGTSLAPYWAEHMVSYLSGAVSLDADVDINLKY